jgi:DNA-binding NtrC family response regulator
MRNVTILLFAPRLRDDLDLQAAFEDEGWHVTRAASARGFAAMLKARPADLVVLDDPPWEMARFALTAMDASNETVPRVWLSSLPEAPVHSGKLGVEALLLAPVDVTRVVDTIAALLAPRSASSSGSHRFFPLGSTLNTSNAPTPEPAPLPGPTTIGLAPRRGRARTDGGWDEESTGNWP